jgi:hypothetical protein
MCLLQIERAGALVKRDPVYWTREYHTSDGVAQVGRGIAWETHHDALPGCVGSGLHQCPVFKVCPAKGLIGDYKKDAPPPADFKKKQ